MGGGKTLTFQKISAFLARKDGKFYLAKGYNLIRTRKTVRRC